MFLWFSKTSSSLDGIKTMDESRAVVDGLGFSTDEVFLYSDIFLTWEGFKVQFDRF